MNKIIIILFYLFISFNVFSMENSNWSDVYAQISPNELKKYKDIFLEYVREEKNHSTRPISDHDYWNRFTLDDSIAIPFLKHCSAKTTVIDLGGADGALSRLALFSGAVVYLIDINKAEIDKAKKDINNLPDDFRERFHAHCIDILKITQSFPNLQNGVDVAYAGNLLHVFDPKNTKEFFDMLNIILKPGSHFFGQVDTLYAKDEGYLMFQGDNGLFNDNYSLDNPYPGFINKKGIIHNYYTITILKHTAKHHGFEVIDIYYLSQYGEKINIEESKNSKIVDSQLYQYLREHKVGKINFYLKKL